ncbi:MAG: DUF6600 domain-containing protein [Verrucomicrobiales bacterium]
MKTFTALFTALVLLGIGAPKSEARVSVTLDFFYEALDPYGDWIYADDYGYCFRPVSTVEDPEWRPYTDGYWTFTDAGWTWVSHEDFGWATYHYGRWALVNDFWVWVPGYDWGPAWVSWRRSREHVGWAPLPPEAEWEEDVGFNVAVDYHYDIGPRCYNFVPVRHFGAPRLRSFVVEPERNLVIIHETRNVTRIVHRSTNVNFTNVYIGGPEFDEVNQFSEHKIRRLRMAEDSQIDAHSLRSGRARNRLRGDEFLVVAPQVEAPQRKVAPPQVAGRVARGDVDRGWRGVDPGKRAEVRQLFERDGGEQAADKRPPKRAPKAATVAAPPPDSVPLAERTLPTSKKETAKKEPAPELKPGEVPSTSPTDPERPATLDKPPGRPEKGRDKVARTKDVPERPKSETAETPEVEKDAQTKPPQPRVPTRGDKEKTKEKEAPGEPPAVAPPFQDPPAKKKLEVETDRDGQNDQRPRRGQDKIKRGNVPADPGVENLPPGDQSKPADQDQKGKGRRDGADKIGERVRPGGKRETPPTVTPPAVPAEPAPPIPRKANGAHVEQPVEPLESPRERKEIQRNKPEIDRPAKRIDPAVERPVPPAEERPVRPRVPSAVERPAPPAPPEPNIARRPETFPPTNTPPHRGKPTEDRGVPAGQQDEREKKGKKQRD